MKKALIVTFIRADNYGAVLQCYALQRKLSDIGIDNDVLDYYPKYFFDEYSMAHLGKLRVFPYRPIGQWIRNTITLLINKKRHQQFEKFIKDNIHLTRKQYTNNEELVNIKLPYDAYIVGSDQVWNVYINRFDPVYFLDFIGDRNKLKLSYSASFGFETIPTELTEKYKTWLSGWDTYSVRESSGASIIMDLLGKEAKVCCDPTLLLNKREWEALCNRYRNRETFYKGAYVFVYYVNTKEKMPLDVAKKIALEKNAKLICMTSIQSYEELIGRRVATVRGKMYGYASPVDFISSIRNADTIVTDSYHGMIFSLLFHKRVLLKIYTNGESNTRMLELINRLDLNCADEMNGFYNICKNADWERIDSLLLSYRKESIDYLMQLAKMEIK